MHVGWDHGAHHLMVDGQPAHFLNRHLLGLGVERETCPSGSRLDRKSVV